MLDKESTALMRNVASLLRDPEWQIAELGQDKEKSGRVKIFFIFKPVPKDDE
jgi:hypothetical protein